MQLVLRPVRILIKDSTITGSAGGGCSSVRAVRDPFSEEVTFEKTSE